VATDLRRINRFYGQPSENDIEKYQEEVTQLLKHGYLKKVTYGFKRGDNWIEPTFMYTAADLAGYPDDDPGKIRPNKNVDDAAFYSYLEYSPAWWLISEDDQQSFKEALPFYRGTGAVPQVDGYVETDKSYSSGGKSLSRSTVRNY
jgi:hypothetical protein